MLARRLVIASLRLKCLVAARLHQVPARVRALRVKWFWSVEDFLMQLKENQSVIWLRVILTSVGQGESHERVDRSYCYRCACDRRRPCDWHYLDGARGSIRSSAQPPAHVRSRELARNHLGLPVDGVISGPLAATDQRYLY